MIEIPGKLNKSDTWLKFRCVIFHSALFHLHELLQERKKIFFTLCHLSFIISFYFSLSFAS